MIYIFSGLFLALCLLSKKIIPTQYKRNVFSFLSFFWSFLFFTYALNESYFVILSNATIIYVFMFVLFFGFTYSLTSRRNVILFSFGLTCINSKHVYIIGLLISICSIIMGLILLRENAYSLSTMRTAILDGRAGGFGLGISLPLALCCMYLAKNEMKKYKYTFFLLISFILAILSTSKIFLILVVIFAIGFNSVISKRKIATYGFIIIFIFGLSSVILGKFSSNPNDGIFSAVIDTFKVYLFSGLAAFDLYTNNNYLLPDNILLYPFRDIIGSTINIPQTDILPWVNSGVWETNVYTGFAPWYQKFGFLSAVIFGVFLGGYYGFWFGFRKNLAVQFYQTFLFFPLILLFFQEHYILSWKMHVAYIACATMLSFTKVEKYE